MGSFEKKMAFRYITNQLRRQFHTSSRLNDMGGHLDYTKDQISRTLATNGNGEGSKEQSNVPNAVKDNGQDPSPNILITQNNVGNRETVESSMERNESSTERVTPKEGDRVKIVYGEYNGVIGLLTSTIDEEGLVKMDKSGKTEILRLDFLQVIKKEA